MAVGGGKNTREADRYLLVPPLDVVTDRLGVVTLLDVSVSGMRVRHTLPIEIGMPLMIRARFETRGTPLTMTGAVVWTRREVIGDDPTYISGIVFEKRADSLNPLLQSLTSSRGARRAELLVSRYA